MSRMKIEVLHARRRAHGTALRDQLVAKLPDLAPTASRLRALADLGGLTRGLVGFTGERPLPAWAPRPFRDEEASRANRHSEGSRGPVTLLVDTFTRWFEPENARAALDVLVAAGYDVAVAVPPDRKGPLCCGRTYLNVGDVDEARRHASRLMRALGDREGPIIGLEPSCLLTLRDEWTVLFPEGSTSSSEAAALSERALLLTELLARDTPDLPLRAHPGRVLVHGHCHEKAFDCDRAALDALRSIPELEVEPIESGCCGLAGSFGYETEHYALSMEMGELDLFPAIRSAPPGTGIVASGTSCRAQIGHGTGARARHPVLLLRDALGRG